MSTLTANRDRLDDELRELRRQRTEAQRETRSLRLEVAEDAPGSATRLAQSLNREDELGSAIAELDRQKQERLAFSNGAHAAATGIFEDPDTIRTLERLGNGSFPIGSVDLGPLSTVEELVQTINTGSWGQPKMAAAGDVIVPDSTRVGTHFGIVPQPRRPLSILDLIPTSPMDSRSFGYMQEGGSWAGAAETAEGAVKPEGDITLTEAEVVAATIAVWKKLRRQQLADVPALQQVISDRLTYSCLRRLENQVLAGDGAGENIQGILTTTGIADIAFSGTVALADLPLDGIVSVMLADAQPDAVAVHPTDWATMLKAREGANSGQRLDSGGAFGSSPAQLWGLPAVPSTALTQGQALVGAFGTGCRLFIREPVNVRVSDNDQDDWTRNRVTALAELRAGLAVFQPSAFALVHLKA
jgi:HK97 family phage major capsid protein